MSKNFTQQYIYYKYVDLSYENLFNKKIITIHMKHGPNTNNEIKVGTYGNSRSKFLENDYKPKSW